MSDTPKLTPSGLAALLCARICHDIINPVGALGTAINLLEDDDNADMHDDAIDLIKVSTKEAWARLDFMRMALGAAGSAPATIACHELQRLTTSMFDDAKASLDWAVEAEGLDKTPGRLLLNMCMMGFQAAPFGGEVNVQATEQGGQARLRVSAIGERVRLEEDVIRGLAGKAPENGFEGRNVQPFYAGLMAREAGGRLEARAEDGRVEFTALVANP